MKNLPAHRTTSVPDIVTLLIVGIIFTTGTAMATGIIQPDLLVSKRSGNGFTGDGTFNTTGNGQKLTQRTSGRAVNSFIKAQNESGRDLVPFTFKGKKGNRKFRTKYFGEGLNITAAVVMGTHSVDLDMMSEVTIRQQVKPTGKLRGKSGKRKFRVTCTHNLDSDAVLIVVRKRQ